MKEIVSGGLNTLSRLLGLTYGGSQTVRIDDGMIQQVIDMRNIIGRGRAVGPAGIGRIVMESEHLIGQNLTQVLDPYDPEFVIAPWPGNVSIDYDVYLVACSLAREAGTASNMTGAALILQESVLPGPSQNNTSAGGAVALDQEEAEYGLAYWDGTESFDQYRDPTGVALVPLGIRIPRGATLSFRVSSTAAVTVKCSIICAVIPQGSRQDVAQ